MVFLRLALAAIGLISTLAFASPGEPRNGAEFVTLPVTQSVKASGSKVEVVQFFMVHCPFCYSIEPELAAQVEKQGDAIAFRRGHDPATGPLNVGVDRSPTARAVSSLDACTTPARQASARCLCSRLGAGILQPLTEAAHPLAKHGR